MGWRNNPIDIRTWLNSAVPKLKATSDYPNLEAQVVLAHYLQKDKTWVLAHPEALISDSIIGELSRAVSRLISGEPLPYITGKSEFFGLTFFVTPAVLIPRPETELLVETAISWLRLNPSSRIAADIGTGSGCIPVSICQAVPSIHFIAVDKSRAALQVARTNIHLYTLENRINFVQGNLLDFLGDKVDLICANLPYIPSRKLSRLQPARFEPHLALDGGPDGLRYTRELIMNSKLWLKDTGLLLIEFETGQEEFLLQIGRNCFPSDKIQVDNDIAGKPRLLRIIRQAKRDMG